MIKDFKQLAELNPVSKAIKENRIKFFKNGSYSYVPSDNYEKHVQSLKSNRVKASVIADIKNGRLSTVQRLVGGKPQVAV